MDFEARLQTFYTALLQPGAVAIDVGAHAGRHTFPMARAVAPSGRVVAVEPLDSCARQIRRTLQLQYPEFIDIVSVESLALSNYEGRADYAVTVDVPAYSGLRTRAYDQPTRVEFYPVEVTTLDRRFGDLPRLDYIKIDAEGGEFHVAQGAEQSLARHRPAISFEFGINGIKEYGFECREMAEFWLKRGYRLFDILGNPLKDSEAFDHSATQMHVWDYVALPAEKEALSRLLF